MIENGGRGRDRTGDLLLAKQVGKNHISFVWRRFQTEDHHSFSLTLLNLVPTQSGRRVSRPDPFVRYPRTSAFDASTLGGESPRVFEETRGSGPKDKTANVG